MKDFETYKANVDKMKNPKYKIIYTLKVYEYLLSRGIKPVEIVPHYMNKKWSAFKYLISRQFCETLSEYTADWYVK